MVRVFILCEFSLPIQLSLFHSPCILTFSFLHCLLWCWLLHEKGLCFLNLHLQGFCWRKLLSSPLYYTTNRLIINFFLLCHLFVFSFLVFFHVHFCCFIFLSVFFRHVICLLGGDGCNVACCGGSICGKGGLCFNFFLFIMCGWSMAFFYIVC